jgi:hypothetical protein
VRFARDDPGGLGQISAYPARLGLNAIVLRQPQTLVLATEAAA